MRQTYEEAGGRPQNVFVPRPEARRPENPVQQGNLVPGDDLEEILKVHRSLDVMDYEKDHEPAEYHLPQTAFMGPREME